MKGTSKRAAKQPDTIPHCPDSKASHSTTSVPSLSSTAALVPILSSAAQTDTAQLVLPASPSSPAFEEAVALPALLLAVVAYEHDELAVAEAETEQYVKHGEDEKG